MASPLPSPSLATVESDGYIPMSPRTLSFLNTTYSIEPSASFSPLMSQLSAIAPPPIHRHLKPRIRKGESPA